jgi:uncharacterized protein YhdP
MDIVAREFVFRGKPLGRLILQTENPSPDQWRINRLSLESDAARVASSGVWQRDASGNPQVRLDFDVDSLDSGRLLDVLGFADTLRAGGGKINGQLRWNGSPVALDLPSLSGRLSMALGRGQFLKTDPGMAKLIGVLSLQSLSRRLTLDFSDVFDKGFAFDAIVGEVSIDQGTASTRSLLMNGVQAQVLISGSADTVRETQDLLVEVLPTVNAGLASLAYAAMANPVVGIGTLLAQMLLETPLRKLFSYEFWVTGPWANPDVKQIQKVRVDESDTPSF